MVTPPTADGLNSAIRLYTDELGALRRMRAGVERLHKEMNNAGIDAYWVDAVEVLIGVANGTEAVDGG